MLLPPGVHEARASVVVLLAGAATDEAAARLGIALPASLDLAVAKRRNEFLAGRWCAREALRAAGLDAPPALAIGDDRAPRWPPGWIGSISHSHGEAWAVAASAMALAGVGVDLERDFSERQLRDLPPRLLAPGEALPDACTANGDAWPDARRAALLFAAKEAFYKCVAATRDVPVGFADARVVMQPGGTLRGVQLLRTVADDLPAGLVLPGACEATPTGVRCCVWRER